jgi:hypothetical protein
MTERKATIILEGDTDSQERAIHELRKFVNEANSSDNLEATMQSERIETTETDMNVDTAFERAGQ